MDNAIMDVLVDHRTQGVITEHQRRLSLGHYTVQMVDAPVPFVYTLGLSAHAGFEIISRGLIPAVLMAAIVREVGDRIKNKEDVFNDLTSYVQTLNNRPLRLRLDRVFDPDYLIKNVALMASRRVFIPDPDFRFYQLLIGDDANVLPGESGYDNQLIQDLYPAIEE